MSLRSNDASKVTVVCWSSGIQCCWKPTRDLDSTWTSQRIIDWFRASRNMQTVRLNGVLHQTCLIRTAQRNTKCQIFVMNRRLIRTLVRGAVTLLISASCCQRRERTQSYKRTTSFYSTPTKREFIMSWLLVFMVTVFRNLKTQSFCKDSSRRHFIWFLCKFLKRLSMKRKGCACVSRVVRQHWFVKIWTTWPSTSPPKDNSKRT